MISEVSLIEYIVIFMAGMFGALVADLIQDNCILLPKKIGDILNLGIFGSLILGGFAGLIIDGSFLTAFMGGFMGKEVISKLISKPSILRNNDDDMSGASRP